jgi:signal transduction histidine kinase
LKVAGIILGRKLLLQVNSNNEQRDGSCCPRPKCAFAPLFLTALLAIFSEIAPAAESASDNPALGKIIRQYVLVSANDFPQRDPFDWRLLGSNDGGKTWVTLDLRRNEVFSGRHQRRAFDIASPKPFETYRLQIDRVRDPKAANSVQLAEIELVGPAGTDVTPVPDFLDHISAQGDNPPAENAAKVFDGLVETKWLDRPEEKSTCASWLQWRYSRPSGILITNASQLLALRARAAEGYPVQINGVFAGHGAGQNSYILDADDCVELDSADAAAGQPTIGQPVFVEGITGWQTNHPLVLKAHVRITGSLAPQNPAIITLEEPMPAGEDLEWVEVEGEIQFGTKAGSGYTFELQDAGSVMRVHLQDVEKSERLPAIGTRVQVRGICRAAFNDQGQWVAAGLWAEGPEAVTVVNPSERSPASGAPAAPSKILRANFSTVTKIEQIRKMSQEQLRARPAVKIRGVITDLVGAFIQDETAGIQVAFPAEDSRKIIAAGMYVEIEGFAGLGDVGNPLVSADHIKVLGRGKFPQPQRLSLSQLLSGRMDAQWIELEGVVRATDGAHLLLICYGQEVTASIGAGSVGVVNQLVDAEVRIRGVGVTALDDNGRIQGTHLLIPSLEQIEVVEEPADPFEKPIRPIGSLLSMSGPRESFHRVHLKGVLTLQEGAKFFLQDDSGSAMGILKSDVLLDPRFGRSRWLFWQMPQSEALASSNFRFSPGDELEIVGFPETRGYSPVLTEVTARKVGGSMPVKPVEATPSAIAAGTLDSTLVILEGIVRGQNSLGAHNSLALEWSDRTLQVLVSTNVDLPAYVPGTRLRITGVCQIDQMPYAELGLRVGAVRILPRTLSDFIVVARPPWWTVRRALMAMGGMTFVILAAFIWIKQLRRQVEERTNQLTSEIQLREQTERQRSLEKERARIAQDLHDDLGANLTQIVFLSQRVEAAQQDAQEVDRWFHLIPATARKTIQSLDEIVWAINPRNDSLESFANYLSQFAQQHMNLARVRCVLDVPMVLPAIVLTAEVRHKLLLAAREALQNVATHADATEVKVTLQLDDEALTITITDNGRGFDANHVGGEGNGLPNMRRRLEDIGGRTEITSQPGKGTTVQLVLQRAQLHGRVIGTNGQTS